MDAVWVNRSVRLARPVSGKAIVEAIRQTTIFRHVVVDAVGNDDGTTYYLVGGVLLDEPSVGFRVFLGRGGQIEHLDMDCKYDQVLLCAWDFRHDASEPSKVRISLETLVKAALKVATELKNNLEATS